MHGLPLAAARSAKGADTSQFFVRAVMRTDIATLSAGTPIRRAAAVLVDGKTPVAPVLDHGGGLIGILSRTACVRSALHASYHREWAGLVANHISRPVVTINADTELIRAAETFLDGNPADLRAMRM